MSNKADPLYPQPPVSPVVLYSATGQPITVINGAVSVALASAPAGFASLDGTPLAAVAAPLAEILFLQRQQRNLAVAQAASSNGAGFVPTETLQFG